MVSGELGADDLVVDSLVRLVEIHVMPVMPMRHSPCQTRRQQRSGASGTCRACRRRLLDSPARALLLAGNATRPVEAFERR